VVRARIVLLAAEGLESAEVKALACDEIYLSILQRKAQTPADFSARDDVAAGILGFQDHAQAVPRPFKWKFTRRDLHRLLKRSAMPDQQPSRKAA
jgi:hypothetical protein